MTVAATTSPAPSNAPVLARAAAAEWTRLWTVRSTWWSLLAAAGLMLLIGAAAGSEADPGETAPIWYAAQFAIVPGQFAFVLLVVLAVGGEYSTGALRSSLQWVPRRGVLLAARVLVPIAVAAVCAVVVAAATDVVAWVFLGDAAEVVPRDIAASLGRIALVVAFGSALAVGLTLLFRSTAGSLTAFLLLVLALPIALGNTGVPWLVAVSDALPGRAIISLVVVEQDELAGSAIARVMVGWTLVALGAGGWSLLRRDAV